MRIYFVLNTLIYRLCSTPCGQKAVNITVRGGTISMKKIEDAEAPYIFGGNIPAEIYLLVMQNIISEVRVTSLKKK